MKYSIEFKPQSIKDLKVIPENDAERIFDRLEILADNLKGDVKRLTNFTPEYRLRVGNYRILFEVENDSKITIYRVLHRKEAYKKRK
jgi:mRNA interferase RelE/StbE